MSPKVLRRTNHPMLVSRYFSTCSNTFHQLFLRQKIFILWHPHSTPIHARSSFLHISLLLLPSKREISTFQPQDKTRIGTFYRCFVQKGFHFCSVWWSGNKRGLLWRTLKSLRLRKVRAQSRLDQSKTPFSQLGSYLLEFRTTALTWTE